MGSRRRPSKSRAPSRSLGDEGADAGGGTLVTDLVSGRPCVRRTTLRVTAGPDTGLVARVDDARVLIGTNRKADLKLSDPRVSRQHAEVSLSDDGVVVRDLESKNGTWVAGQSIQRVVVSAGVELLLGDTRIVVEAEDAPVSLPAGVERFGELSSQAPSMQSLFALLERVAPSDATLLLEGETGAGKDVLTRAVHAASRRGNGPLIVFDCGAVSRELIASELFGHRRGAFTGAVTDRVGVFEAAAGGTVFLDEVGELSLDLQPALLRVLENRQVTRVGESVARDIDVRVICATHRDLRARVEQGSFREDLFFRLAVVRARVPALRDRPEDILALADLFLAEHGLDATDLSAADRAFVLGYRWPGNVRQLKNTLERSAVLRDGPLVISRPTDDDAPRPDSGGFAAPGQSPRPDDEARMHLPYKQARQELLDDFERRYLLLHLDHVRGNVSRLAERVGLARPYVHKLLKRHGIQPSAARQVEPLGASSSAEPHGR